VKDVFTLSGENGTVVAGDVAVGTTAIKRHTTDSTDIVVGDIPFPHRHRVDAFHFDLHLLTARPLGVEKVEFCPLSIAEEKRVAAWEDGDSSAVWEKAGQTEGVGFVSCKL